MAKAEIGDRVRLRPYLQGIGGLEAVVVGIEQRRRKRQRWDGHHYEDTALTYILELDDGRRRRLGGSFDVIQQC